jgi:uncharacterized OsmC-like protein
VNADEETDMATTATMGQPVNGLDVAALREAMRDIEHDPGRGRVEFRVRSDWRGQTRSRTTVSSYTFGGKEVHRHFTIDADEPFDLLGRNTAPNPQELLMAAFNACITVGYAAAAALRGIALEKIQVETSGALDLRGFLGLDPTVSAGYDALHYVVRVKGAGTPAQLQEIHEVVARTSPNYFNISRPVRIDARLVVE